MKASQKLTVSLSVLATLTLANGAMAQQNSNTQTSTERTTTPGSTMSGGMIGTESKAGFDRMNKKGAASVSAIRPTSAKLSATDSKLMMDVAKGGMMQLEVSKIAAEKATSPEVRELAQAEVEEQTGLAAKLQEIATAKGITLPSSPDADAQAVITRMQNLQAGMAFDKAYVQESGVNGHQQIDMVMSKVKAQATDKNLKSIEMAAHPLVKTHLQVSREVLKNMATNTNGMNR